MNGWPIRLIHPLILLTSSSIPRLKGSAYLQNQQSLKLWGIQRKSSAMTKLVSISKNNKLKWYFRFVSTWVKKFTLQWSIFGILAFSAHLKSLQVIGIKIYNNCVSHKMRKTQKETKKVKNQSLIYLNWMMSLHWDLWSATFLPTSNTCTSSGINSVPSCLPNMTNGFAS